MMQKIKIVSGGQTGVDRAALDFAIENNIPHGGWCPKGRLAEDGPIDTIYQLNETNSDRYEQRTEWNIRDSDGTAIFSNDKNLSGGTLYTYNHAKKLDKPLIVINPTSSKHPSIDLIKFITDNHIKTLNIAGPRASNDQNIYDDCKTILEQTFKNLT